MCGIAGVVSNQITSETRRQFRVAFDCLRHRGPNGQNYVEIAFKDSFSNNVILGHHRLAIVDLSERANQPLVSKSGSSLIINGEIYNSEELRDQLKHRYDFVTTSDSEVALAVLEIFGISGVAKLDGMFAFAFHPAGDSSIWLGRDRLGIKPLYFSRNNDEIWFSSEAKPLAKALSRNLDEMGIAEWVQYQFQVSSRTFFEEIHSVPPGHLLTIKDGFVKSRQYWNFEDHLASNTGRKFSERSVAHDLHDLLEASVSRHLMSDVEVATIVSGGMDSSTVSSLAAKFGVKQAFVGRYQELGFDETHFALSLAEHAGLNLRIIDISEGDFFDALESVAECIDYPTAGPGSVGQYLVAQEVAKQHRVVLAGTGGDELFLGYTRDRFPLWAASQKQIKGLHAPISNPPNTEGYEALFERFIKGGGWESPIAGFMSTLERSASESTLLSISKHRQIAITAELRAFISPSGGESLTEIHDSLLRYEVSRFLPSLLQVEDRMTMAHGLESRVPLLDLELVEYLISLPVSIRMYGNLPKDLLRLAMKKYLPNSIIERRDKMGFPVPFIIWNKTDSSGHIRTLLDSLAGRAIPGVKVATHNAGGNGSHLDARELWGALLLESWLRSLE